MEHQHLLRPAHFNNGYTNVSILSMISITVLKGQRWVFFILTIDCINVAWNKINFIGKIPHSFD
mgnify:CR=1 FL=1